MRVGLDARPALFSSSGIGRYVRELLRALAELRPRDVAFVLHAEALRRAPAEREEELGRIAARGGFRLHRTRLPGRLQRSLAPLGFEIGRRIGCDLFHVTDLTAPPLRETPFVLTLHDVAWRVDPSFHTAAFRRGAGARTERLARRARRIVVPSRATRDEAIARLGLDASRIDVVPHGADHALRPMAPRCAARAEQLLRAAGVRGSFALSVATIEPRKNHLRLLEAHARARRSGGLDLVLVGAQGWRCREVIERLRAHPPGVHWLGPLPDGEVLALLERAAFSVYPSIHEGFGLPVLESMARSRAVLASRIPPIEEVTGEAALLVDPLDADALAEGYLRLSTDEELRRRLAVAGERRAGSFRWRDSARRHLAVYRRAAGNVSSQED